MNGLKVNHTVFFLLIITVLVASCYSGNERLESKIPPDALDRNTMIDLLTDIHLIEGILSQKQIKGVLAFELAEIYYDSLFVKYAIQKAQLDSSIAYYSRNPEVYEKIYTEVITNLSKIESVHIHIPGKDPDSLLIPEPQVAEIPEPFWFKNSQNPWIINTPANKQP
jgi:hypothetical protein